jgi:hypothetical protein
MPKRWGDEVSTRFDKAGLLTPRSKAAKVRAALPWIEEALANGYTRAQCMEQLRLLGVNLTPLYFKRALERARKQAPIATREVSVTPIERKQYSREKQEQTSEPKETRKVAASGATIVLKQKDGMFISSVEEKDQQTNAMPKMEDFM